MCLSYPVPYLLVHEAPGVGSVNALLHQLQLEVTNVVG